MLADFPANIQSCNPFIQVLSEKYGMTPEGAVVRAGCNPFIQVLSEKSTAVKDELPPPFRVVIPLFRSYRKNVIARKAYRREFVKL